MTKADKVDLFRMAVFYSGSALIVGALIGFAIGIGITDDRR